MKPTAQERYELNRELEYKEDQLAKLLSQREELDAEIEDLEEGIDYIEGILGIE